MDSLFTRLSAAIAPRYLVLRELAAGGMGRVFVGRDPVLERDVAIKVLPPEMATAVARERFDLEAKLLARLNHPGIVAVLEARQVDGLSWFVMPLITAPTLAQIIAKGPVPARDVERLARQLLSALQQAHALGVIHRDIKPSNVFWDSEHALLADFGVARATVIAHDTLTDDGQLVGTPGYMAPEQRQGVAASIQSDLYSLAATLYEAATIRRWDGPANAVWKGMSPGMRRALQRALQPNPESRWQSAAAFASALRSRRHLLWRTAIVACVLLISGVFAGMFMVSAAAPVPRVAHRYDMALPGMTGLGDSLDRELSHYTRLQLECFPPIDMQPFSDTATGTLPRTGVSARITRTGEGVGIVVALELRDSVNTPVGVPQVKGLQSDLPTLARDIAETLVNRRHADRIVEFHQYRGPTVNRVALSLYYDGETAMQQQDWSAAQDFYHRAFESDTTFLVAKWAELVALQWARKPFESALAALMPHAQDLPEPVNELVRIQLEPDIRTRLDGFSRIAHRYPTYGPARMLYANELFHRGALVGYSLHEAIDSLLSAADVVPGLAHAATYDHTIWGSVRLGLDSLGSDQLARRDRQPPANDQWGELIALSVDARFHPWKAALKKLVMRVVVTDHFINTDMAGPTRIGLEWDLPVEQEFLGGLLARRGDTGEHRASGFAAMATALLLQGRPLAAREHLIQGIGQSPLDSGYGQQQWEWPLALRWFGVTFPDSILDSARKSLGHVPESDPLWPRAAWTLALDAIVSGQFTVSDSRIAALQRHSASDAVAADLAVSARALSLGARRHPDSALALTNRSKMRSDSVELLRLGPFGRAVIAFARGGWQLDLHHPALAEIEWRWHENSDLFGWPGREPQQGELDAALSGIARLRRAENLCEMGRPAEARPLLLRAIELWKAGDATFDSLRSRATDLRERCQ